MREASTRRDQREIVVPRDMRSAGTAKRAAPRRSGNPQSTGSSLRELLANLVAGCRWAVRTVLARPGEAFGSFAALTAVGYVCVNALGLQTGRHPAPILPQASAQHAKADPAPAAKPSVAPATASQAAAEPAVAKATPEPKHAEKPAARDAIGDILRSAGDTTASVTPKAADKVAQAQRALSKLGYGAIKADGVMGPTTKAAIEKFERDRKLPVTGEAAGRTLRELAAKAGTSKG